MARKTRQEKIIADLKRRLQAQEIKSVPVPQIAEKPRQEFKPQGASRPSVDTFSIPINLVKKDLLRTAILTIVAISLEFVLYLMWH